MLEVKNLNIEAQYKEEKVSIIKRISFEVNAGEKLAIVGESGSGKTMTAMAILGLLPDNCYAKGEIYLDNKNILKLSKKELKMLRGKEIVLIPQSGADFLNPVLKVKTQIYETLKKNGIRGKDNYNILANKLLRKVGFINPDDIINKYPFQLSGGMAQRVVLAIGLAFEPKVVIADEPTRGIDDETAQLFIKELDIMFPKSSVIIITHNISIAHTCNKLLVMKEGIVQEYGEFNKIIKFPKSTYTRELFSALPNCEILIGSLNEV